jgi:hypothetical protein
MTSRCRTRTGSASCGSAECLFWIAAALLIVLVDQLVGRVGSVLHASMLLGALTMAFGARAFLAHGGPRITTLGLVNAACALFVGYGSIQESVSPQNRTPEEYLTIAVLSAAIVQIVATCVAWSRFAPRTTVDAFASDEDGRWVARAGGAMLVGLLTVRLLELPFANSQLVEAATFTSVTLLAIGIFFRTDARPFSVGTGLVIAAFAVYVVYFQGGSGRLRMVALACVVVLLFTARFPHRVYKLVAVALSPLMVMLLALQRLNLQENLHRGASIGRNGLESMTDPIVVFAQIIYAQSERSWPLAMGRTFMTLPLALLPEDLAPWRDRTPLGYELVELTAPDRRESGYSVAATVFGEWWYNWSIFGLLLLIPTLAAVLVVADRHLDRAVLRVDDSRWRLLQLSLWAMLCGSVGDLVWAGLHTYGARMLIRLPVLLVLMVLVRVQMRWQDHNGVTPACREHSKSTQ